VAPARPGVARRDSSAASTQVPRLGQAIKLVDENAVFCDTVGEFMTDNFDFTVIGVLGLQNTGKSTILNALARLHDSDEEDVFRVQTFEHQMLAEHCTNGVDVFVTRRRQVLLDCQPLLSASVMDRTIQLEKKFSSEFCSTEGTVEVHCLHCTILHRTYYPVQCAALCTVPNCVAL
jgi:protein SMG9